MTGNSGDRPKPPTERERREARLAEALRTNLRRRKAAGQGAPLPKGQGSDKPEPGET